MPFPDAAALTRRIVRRLEDEDPIVLYPVRAASVGAYLGRGLVGSVIDAIVERRAALNDEGVAGVSNGDVVLSTDSDTAASLSRESSFRWKGRLYDIIRIEDDGPGAVTCYTTEFA